jgi:type I restriction enzyme S subunit
MITAVDCTILKIDKSKYDADFIAYLLNTDEWLALCKRFSRGSTRQRITRSALGDLTIQVPSIDEQRAFAKKIAIIKDALLAEQAAIEKIKALKKETITKLISGGDTQ